MIFERLAYFVVISNAWLAACLAAAFDDPSTMAKLSAPPDGDLPIVNS
jgi:hypothetical protein